VQYIARSRPSITDVLQSLENGYSKAKKIYDAGDPNAKITKIDLDAIEVSDRTRPRQKGHGRQRHA